MNKVQTKKKKINIRRLVVLLIILFLLGYSFYYVFNQNIKNIVIKGNKLVSDVDIITSVGIEDYPPIFKIKSSKMEKGIKENPLINKVDINKSILGRLTITVEENKVLFINYLNNTYVLSDNSEIENNGEYTGLPILLNFVPSNIFEKFISELSKIDSSIVSLISEIEYSPSTNENGDIIDEDVFLLRMNDKNLVFITSFNISALNHYIDIYNTQDKQVVIYCDLASSTKCVIRDSIDEKTVIEEETKEDENKKDEE